MSRRESVGRVKSVSQSASSEQTVKTVSVAVLPPRLPPGMAPPTGLGAADAIFGWDEALNWQHNDPARQQEPSRRKSFFRKAGITTQRKRTGGDDDLPPLIMRQIPYDTWRKHYAKDANGFYRGTEEPAEDCLLKPEDLQKWRSADPVTKADKWSRGTEVLGEDAGVKGRLARGESLITPEDDPLAEYFDGRDTMQNTGPATSIAPRTSSTAAQSGRIVAGGKTAAEIIEEAEAKPKHKMTWKEKFSKGANMAMMGN